MFSKVNHLVSPVVRAGGLVVVLATLYGPLQAAQYSVQASPRLAAWVDRVLELNPELQAVTASVAAVKARLTGAGLPIYNPELEVEYERSEIDTLTAGVSQTLDWHGKQRAKEVYLSKQARGARADHQALREQLAGDLLMALVEIDASQTVVELNKRQVALLGRFAGVAKKRGQAGDLGEIEVELAQLALVEGEMSTASARSEASASREALMRLAGTMQPDARLPNLPPLSLPKPFVLEDYLAQHPLLVKARAQSQVASSAIRRVDIERRADPTLGVRGGMEDDQALIGLQLSIPLQVRNTRTADVDAARSESDQAVQQLMQVERNIRARMQATHARFGYLSEAWNLWEAKGRKGLDARVSLLEKLWRVGELSTTDYLVQLKQSMDTESAGMLLRRDLWRAWISWLQASGQVSAWLGLNVQGEVQ